MESLFVDMDPLYLEIELRLSDIWQKCMVRQEILNVRKGSVLDKWMDFDCSSNISRNELIYLEKMSTPEIIKEKMDLKNGKIFISLKMEPNEIRLIRITKD